MLSAVISSAERVLGPQPKNLKAPVLLIPDSIPLQTTKNYPAISRFLSTGRSALLTDVSLSQSAPNGEAFGKMEHQMPPPGFGVLMAIWGFFRPCWDKKMASGPGKGEVPLVERGKRVFGVLFWKGCSRLPGIGAQTQKGAPGSPVFPGASPPGPNG
ncbi:hypothetical protein OUZ56_018450 [Daphnia magna]|uniref:Uncharacterized protein n=1 Tax=Daphnia magna TaxID=35525 RepID=A0ABQ9Z908_9CRUS|nr:hypothetical protein OUZ56_018450 [Daphnia magna]